MLMAFLLVSSWLPAQRKHADPSDRSTLPEQSHEENTYNIEEPEGTWRRKRGRTLGRLVLLQVALAGRLGLLAVAAAHGGWIRRRSMAATRAVDYPPRLKQNNCRFPLHCNSWRRIPIPFTLPAHEAEPNNT